MEPKVYEIKDCMKTLKLSRNTVAKLISSGQLKAVKAGDRRWLIPAWALNDFLGKPQQGA